MVCHGSDHSFWVGPEQGDLTRPVIFDNLVTRSDVTRPDPTRPDPTRSDPTRPASF